MAFDGITIAAMVQELHKNLDNGRFNKIAQPEADALMITGKGANGQCRLFVSASPSLPLIYFTGKNKPSPLTRQTSACCSASIWEVQESEISYSRDWNVW